jgi:hypothetical protein
MQPVQFAAAASNVSADLISDGVVRIALRPGARMTAVDWALAREKLLALTGGRPSVVLLQVTGVGSVSREAVSFYSEASAVRAFAILGSSPVDRVIAHRMLGLHRMLELHWPERPTQFFTDAREAMSWLRRQIPGARIVPVRSVFLSDDGRGAGQSGN